MRIGGVRPAVEAMPVYRPGKAAEQAEEEHGITDAIKLASNENPYPPVPSVVAAIAEAATGVNRYCDHLAIDLRTALGDMVGLDLDHIAVGCGSVGLLQQLCLAYLDPGDLAALGFAGGDLVEIESEDGAIASVVETSPASTLACTSSNRMWG